MGAGAAAGVKAVVNEAKPKDLKDILAECSEADRQKLLEALGGVPAKPKAAMKIHGMSVSANAMVCLLLAKDLGCGDLENCDLMSGAHLKPEFIAKNPFHQIPTMEDGDFCCAESNVIARYMASTMGSDLYPADAKLRARIGFAMDATGGQIYDKVIVPLVYPILGFAGPNADPAKALKDAKEALDNYTKTFFGQGKFLCGDKLTIADYKAIPYLLLCTADGFDKKTGLAVSDHVKTYCKNCSEAMSNFSCLTDAFGDFSMMKFFAAKLADAKDFDGEKVTAGEEVGPAIVTGAAVKDEKGMKIHGMPISANCVGPVMAAMDAGCGALELCDLMNGAQMTPEFLKKNAFHTVPTMETSDGFCTGESATILRYVAENYSPDLYAADPKAKAKIDWAIDATACVIYSKVAKPLMYPVFGFGPAPEDQAAANKSATEALDMYEKAFLKGKFVNGDKLSIAEYKVIPFLFGVMQPAVEKKTGFTLSDRMKKYVADFMASSKSSGMLESAGGFSIKEYAATKE